MLNTARRELPSVLENLEGQWPRRPVLLLHEVAAQHPPHLSVAVLPVHEEAADGSTPRYGAVATLVCPVEHIQPRVAIHFTLNAAHVEKLRCARSP